MYLSEHQSLKKALFNVRREYSVQDICLFWCTDSQRKPLKTSKPTQDNVYYKRDLRLNLNISDTLILFWSYSYCFTMQLKIFVRYLHPPLPFCLQSVPFTGAHPRHPSTPEDAVCLT